MGVGGGGILNPSWGFDERRDIEYQLEFHFVRMEVDIKYELESVGISNIEYQLGYRGGGALGGYRISAGVLSARFSLS